MSQRGGVFMRLPELYYVAYHSSFLVPPWSLLPAQWPILVFPARARAFLPTSDRWLLYRRT